MNSEFEVLYAFMEKLPAALAGRKSGDPYISFRGRPDRKEGFQRAEASRDLQRDRSGCHPSFSGGVYKEQPCSFYQNALGSQGKRIIVMIYSSRKGRDFYGKKSI